MSFTFFASRLLLAKLTLRVVVRGAYSEFKLRVYKPVPSTARTKNSQTPASGPGLPYNAGFVRQLVGKWVYHGNSRPNPLKAGHLGCLYRHAQSCFWTEVTIKNIRCVPSINSHVYFMKPQVSGFSVGCCINREKGYLLPSWIRKEAGREEQSSLTFDLHPW